MAQIGGSFGAFVPTTNVWDTAEIENIDVTKPEFKELLIRLYQNLNNISNVLNLKDTGYYYPLEFLSGQRFSSNPGASQTSLYSQVARQGFRFFMYFGALPNSTTKSVPHGLSTTYMTSATRIYGASTNSTIPGFIPIPYASASNNNIELYIDGTNINIATNSNWSAYTNTYVVFEYLKQ
jgi:hypothetical protein